MNMKKKRRSFSHPCFLILFLVLLVFLTTLFGAVVSKGTATAGTSSITAGKHMVMKLNTEDHMKFMDCGDDGLFRPEDPLTRAEAAEMIFSLVSVDSRAELADAEASFDDVVPGTWAYPIITTLARYGILSGKPDGNFHPDDAVTRAEFTELLTSFFENLKPLEMADDEEFRDVPEDYWARKAILFAVRKNWITGYPDGTFHPDGALSRAEASVIVNRVLERSADMEVLSSSQQIRIFPDVETWNWAYASIMEATIDHEYTKEESKTGQKEMWTFVEREGTPLLAGYHVIDGILYFVDENTGDFVRNQYVENHWFDAQGRYTTGNVELDDLVRTATRDCVTADMTQHEMLQAVFDYIVDNCTYRKNDILKMGSTGWTEKYALSMLSSHKGNCYCFASAFYELAKNVGYDPREVAGRVCSGRVPHGWVEIDVNGRTYMYDPCMTYTCRRDGENKYIFELRYKRTPFTYVKNDRD